MSDSTQKYPNQCWIVGQRDKRATSRMPSVVAIGTDEAATRAFASAFSERGVQDVVIGTGVCESIIEGSKLTVEIDFDNISFEGDVGDEPDIIHGGPWGQHIADLQGNPV